MTLFSLTGSGVRELLQLLLAMTVIVKTTNKNVLNESFSGFNKMYYFFCSLTKKKSSPQRIVCGIDFVA